MSNFIKKIDEKTPKNDLKYINRHTINLTKY